MNWPAISFDWNQVRAFLATVEEGTLSAAARALNLTQPTLGRQVAALEQSLGVALFDRIGRSLVLTPAGLELLDHVRAMGEAAHKISLSATGQSQTIAGLVRISASDGVAALTLPRILADLSLRAPAISVDVVSTNELSDLRRREADIAIRHVRPDDPELVSRQVKSDWARFYAAPSYLRRHGPPPSADDPTGAIFISYGETDRMVEFLNARGLAITRDQVRYSTNNTMAICEMVRLGLGICIMSDEMAAQTPGLERVLTGFAPIPVETWLTTHRELYTSLRIRTVFDHLAAALSDSTLA